LSAILSGFRYGAGMAQESDDSLTRRIRDAIVSGEFVASQRLVEADLTARFEASRSAVRLALIDLSHEGLVERLPNRGARVRAISVDEAIEIVEARTVLKALCARKTAEHLGEEEAAELRALRAELIAAVDADDLSTFWALIQELDRRLRDYSGHDVAAALLERLQAQFTWHQFRLVFWPGRARTSLGEHLAIIDAVLAGDADGAERATKEHLEDVMRMLARIGQATEAGSRRTRPPLSAIV